MCGIAGCITKKGNVLPFLINALEMLNTRGYDGYGICTAEGRVEKVGPRQLETLKMRLEKEHITSTIGIAHNRWATHGEATEENAHPHKSHSIIIIHNGIIDNYATLKEELSKKGFTFNSETDSEVFAALVAYYRSDNDFFTAVKKALLRIEETSAYAFLIMDQMNPTQLIATQKGSSPLLWSFKGGATYIASEEAAFNSFVQKYHQLHDGEIALFTAGKLLRHENMTNDFIVQSKTYEIDPEHYQEPEKTSEFYMYLEMMQAPDVIARAIGTRATTKDGIVLGGVRKTEIQARLRSIKKFYIAGCGTSYHAAQIIAAAIREIASVDAEAVIASEALYAKAVFDPSTTALVAVSQSGETADLVKLIGEWKPRGILMLGIVNVPNRQISRLTDAGIYCHIGREVAVASTKAFLGEVVCGIMFAIYIGQQRNLSIMDRERYIKELRALPQKAAAILKQEQHIRQIAEKYASARNFLYMGRSYNSIVAYEGALKLKEITWSNGNGINAFGISAGEMKHGTIAMIDESFPSFVIAPNDSVFTVTKGNLKEIKARKGKIILVTTRDAALEDINPDDVIYVPSTLELFSPLLTVIPAQIFAFYTARALGCNPDLPRNLAKSVTVE